MSALFGPGGNCEEFAKSGLKSSLYAPQWVKDYGLDAYEYEAGRGIHASPSLLAEMGENAKRLGINMSFHTPYFISLSSVEKEKRVKSVGYIMESAAASELLGASVMVVHCGSCAKITREQAMEYASETLLMADKALKESGFKVKLGIETMGKINQLGTLDEVLTLCTLSKNFVPVVDFGHLNARTLGSIKTEADYEYIFDEISRRLGKEYADTLHCHFSKIEYTGMGEKKHLTFEDELYGPSPESLAQVIARKGLSPTIICESAGTQSYDAKILKNEYEKAKNN